MKKEEKTTCESSGAAPLPPGAPVYASPESFPLLCASAALVVPVILTNLCVATRREGGAAVGRKQ